MASYGTKQYWEEVCDKSTIMMDSLMRSVDFYKDDYYGMNLLCTTFTEHYNDFVRAKEEFAKLEEETCL